MTVRRSLGISAFTQFSSFGIQFASVIVVSRLLTPEEVGVFSVAVATLGFAHIFREFGVANYLIQVPEISKERFRAAFSVTLLISWIIAILLLLLRWPLSGFYGHPGLSEVLGLISANFIILPFGTPLLALLRRDMQFDKLAVIGISNALVSAVVTIATAAFGASYMSMAWGAVAGSISNVVILNFMRPGEIFMMPSVRGVGEILRFGSLSSASSLIAELASSAPDLILGKTLGFSDVALYSRANGLRQMATTQVTRLVHRVYFPLFAQALRDGGDPALLYSRAIGYVVAITAPTLALLAVIAEPLIQVLFGDQWLRAAPLASIICGSALFATPTSMAAPSLIAAGKVGLLLRADLTVAATRVGALASSVILDLTQVTLLVAVTYLIELVVYLKAMNLGFGLRASTLWVYIRGSVLLVAITTLGPIGVMFFAGITNGAVASTLVVLISLATGAIGWLFGVFIIAHPLWDEIRRLIGRARLPKPSR